MQKNEFENIPVFYTPLQVTNVELTSPSAAKPAAVIQSWIDKKFPIQILAPNPVGTDELCLAHDPKFVAEILSCERRNGFGTRSPEVAETLPWTSGSMLSAARHVVTSGGVAVAPCSGFHHAGYDNANGFCTFNGLMVTAAALKRDNLVQTVGILDCDQHYGDGTEDIIKRLRAESWIHHITANKGYSRNARSFLSDLREIVREFSACELLIYQAGADQHKDDPLGGFLSSEQLATRDQIVFDEARCQGVPLIWNLAGGYQRPIRRVLDIHDRTMSECVATYVRRVQ